MKCPQCDKDCDSINMLVTHMTITGHCMAPTPYNFPEMYKQAVATGYISKGQVVTVDDVKLCPEIFNMTVDDIVMDFMGPWPICGIRSDAIIIDDF